MTRFTDKISVFLIVASLGVYGYATYTQAANIHTILDQLVLVWSEQLFPLVIIATAILVFKLNFVLSWVLVLAGYMLFTHWPVEDYPALFQQLIFPETTGPNFGVFSSTLAWNGYAFLLMVALVDVLRIASSAIRAASIPEPPATQSFRR